MSMTSVRASNVATKVLVSKKLNNLPPGTEGGGDSFLICVCVCVCVGRRLVCCFVMCCVSVVVVMVMMNIG